MAITTMNLIWFRNDLRVDDNPALFHACENPGEATIAVYFFCVKQFLLHGVGINQQRLILQALKNLKRKLKELNIQLLIIESEEYQQASNDLVQFCLDNKVTDIYFNHEYGFNEITRDEQIISGLTNSVSCHAYHDQCLTQPEQIVNQSGNGYKVFSAYARAVSQRLSEYPNYCYPLPEAKSTDNLSLFDDSLFDPLLLDKLDEKLTTLTHPSKIRLPLIDENSLWQQLFEFCSSEISDYKNARDIPSITGTSSLSSGLAVGAISVKRCYQLAKEIANENATCWINELVWRDFYRSVMWHFPRVSKGQAFNSVDCLINWSKDNKALELWKKGQTGVPIIDAAINQLLHTGWMHNRLRMIVASYLTKNLWIDWREGERFFAQHLFDYDFASNNGGWQWCASVGTDAAPYFRVFNPATQQKRFDPEAKFIKQWLPQLKAFSAKQIHQFETKPLADYYPQIVDLKSSRKQAIETFKIAKSTT